MDSKRVIIKVTPKTNPKDIYIRIWGWFLELFKQININYFLIIMLKKVKYHLLGHGFILYLNIVF